MEKKKTILNFATLSNKREECLTERVILYNNITKSSFNPYCPERSFLCFLKTKLTYVFIFALFCGTVKKSYEGALTAFIKLFRGSPKKY